MPILGYLGAALLQALHTYTEESSFECPVAALLPTTHTLRNPYLGIQVKLCCRLYILRTYSEVSWWSSAAGHIYTQEPTLRYPDAALLKAIQYTYVQWGTFSSVLWWSSSAGYTYTQEPILWFSGEPLQASCTVLFFQEPTLEYILLQLCCQLDPIAAILPARTYFICTASIS